ncbi:MAG: hypothetical protein KGM24_03190 [Elusimicrobia bacterium]|nr:hypothetical protein [Elusimicrobiota bacterium]
MGLLFAAVLAVLAAAPARAGENAYVSLVGMASAAATDRGPEAGSVPRAGGAGGRLRGALSPEGADVPPSGRSGVRSAAPGPAGASAAGRAVFLPPGSLAPAGRGRRRFFADLLPYWRSGPVPYDGEPVPVSGAPAARVRRGVALGWDELFAAAAAPVGPPAAR